MTVGWGVGIDFIRCWLFNDAARLRDFNDNLTLRKQDTIQSYNNLLDMKDATVLDTCRLAKGTLQDFTDKHQRKLVDILDHRNDYSHANFQEATKEGVEASLQKMIAVLTSPPFV